jgi:Transport and Golgi organisation 2
MCTVTWLHDDDGYQLFCNRDEKLSRAPALPPRMHERNGVRYVAPVDGNFGGAWIGANEFGVSICLLNGVTRGGGVRSRGLLLPELLSAASVADVQSRVEDMDLLPYSPFTLAVLEPGQHTSVIEWDGLEKVIVPAGDRYLPLVSSSFDPEGVRRRRCEEFARRLDAAGRLDASVLFAFHASRGRQADAYSTWMHRSDARTVSFSWIRVNGAAVEFLYID